MRGDPSQPDLPGPTSSPGQPHSRIVDRPMLPRHSPSNPAAPRSATGFDRLERLCSFWRLDRFGGGRLFGRRLGVGLELRIELGHQIEIAISVLGKLGAAHESPGLHLRGPVQAFPGPLGLPFEPNLLGLQPASRLIEPEFPFPQTPAGQPPQLCFDPSDPPRPGRAGLTRQRAARPDF